MLVSPNPWHQETLDRLAETKKLAFGLLVACETIEGIFRDNTDEDGFYDCAIVVEQLDEYRAALVDIIGQGRVALRKGQSNEANR